MKIELCILNREIKRQGRRYFLGFPLRDALSFLNHTGYGLINLGQRWVIKMKSPMLEVRILFTVVG